MKKNNNKKTTKKKDSVSKKTAPPAKKTASAAPKTAPPTRMADTPAERPRKNHFSKKREIATILLSIAFGFTLWFFAPADIFVANQHEFIISAPKILFPLLGIAAGASLATAALLNIFLAIDIKLWKIVSSLLLGVLLAGYAQMMFMNGRMVTITGDATPYSEPTAANIINLIIYGAIALLPLALILILGEISKKKKVRFIVKAATFISLALIIMQTVGFIGQLGKVGIERKDDSQFTNYLSYSGAFHLNKDDNIVVFLTDRLDAAWTEELLGKYPDLNSELEGFTFYPNNVACFTNTFPAVPQMLTGHEYDGGPWYSYLSESWSGNTLPRRLRDNSYRVNLIMDALTTYNGFNELKEQCDNIGSSEDYISYDYFGSQGILRTMADFSLGKLSPYLLKGSFLDGYASDFANSFYTLSDPTSDRLEGSIGIASDNKFTRYLQENSVAIDSDQKTFSFIHLNFAHDSNKAAAQLYPEYSGDPDLLSSIRGGFSLLDMYFEQMKEAGVYDNSTIIIIGDHGRPPAEIESGEKDQLNGAVRTALFIKPRGAKREELKINKEAELSNAYFASSVLGAAGLPHEDFGPSYDELMSAKEYPPRYLKVYRWHGVGSIDDILKYEITGDSSDYSNWKIIEREGKPIN